MKIIISISLFILSSSISVLSQDMIYKLDGEKLIVKVSKVNESNVEFTYKGETASQVLTKKSIEKIVYESGREDKLNSKLRVYSESDYNLVTITMDEKEVSDFRRIGEISAKQSIPYGARNKLRDKALIKLKKESAKIGGHIILLQLDDFSNSPINTVTLSGVAYGYK